MRCLKIYFILIFLLAVFLISCGGSSNNSNLTIKGNFTSSETKSTLRTTLRAAVSIAQIELCCSDHCAITNQQGSFTLQTDYSPNLLCQVNMLSNSDEIIISLPNAGSFLVTININTNTHGENEYEIESTEENTNTNDDLTNPPVCGNGVAELGGGEDCDSSDLAGGTCKSIGFSFGTLSCNSDCSYDTSACVKNESTFCGDNVQEGGEECDGTDLNGETCESKGFAGGGTVSCDAGCLVDTSNCLKEPKSCDPKDAICADGKATVCRSCTCDDGFEIGNCNAICSDSGAKPTWCSGGYFCEDGSTAHCP